MRSIHFCHLTDSHLGNRQYGLIERFDDFAKAFSESITKIIEIKPDFAIYTGDLFDVSKPQAPELRQALRVLEKLKNANIPLYLIQGNHDVSYSQSKRYGGDILEFLADFGLFKYMQDEISFFEQENEKLALLMGINYYGKRTTQVLKQLVTTYETELTFEGPRILLLHAFVQGMPSDYDITLESLREVKFDYVGVGHLHDRWEDLENNIHCPGSTEHTSSTEWKQPDRGFFDVKMDQNEDKKWISKIKYVKIPIRSKYTFKHVFKSSTIVDIREEAQNILQQNDIQDAVLRFVFQGQYDGKEHPFANLEQYRKIPKKALHVIIISKFLEAQKRDERLYQLSKREIYTEFLKTRFQIPEPLIEDYISVIEDSLKIVDEDSTVADQETSLDKRYDRFARKILNIPIPEEEK